MQQYETCAECCGEVPTCDCEVHCADSYGQNFYLYSGCLRSCSVQTPCDAHCYNAASVSMVACDKLLSDCQIEANRAYNDCAIDCRGSSVCIESCLSTRDTVASACSTSDEYKNCKNALAGVLSSCSSGCDNAQQDCKDDAAAALAEGLGSECTIEDELACIAAYDACGGKPDLDEYFECRDQCEIDHADDDDDSALNACLVGCEKTQVALDNACNLEFFTCRTHAQNARTLCLIGGGSRLAYFAAMAECYGGQNRSACSYGGLKNQAVATVPCQKEIQDAYFDIYYTNTECVGDCVIEFYEDAVGYANCYTDCNNATSQAEWDSQLSFGESECLQAATADLRFDSRLCCQADVASYRNKKAQIARTDSDNRWSCESDWITCLSPYFITPADATDEELDTIASEKFECQMTRWACLEALKIPALMEQAGFFNHELKESQERWGWQYFEPPGAPCWPKCLEALWAAVYDCHYSFQEDDHNYTGSPMPVPTTVFNDCLFAQVPALVEYAKCVTRCCWKSESPSYDKLSGSEELMNSLDGLGDCYEQSGSVNTISTNYDCLAAIQDDIAAALSDLDLDPELAATCSPCLRVGVEAARAALLTASNRNILGSDPTELPGSLIDVQPNPGPYLEVLNCKIYDVQKVFETSISKMSPP